MTPVSSTTPYPLLSYGFVKSYWTTLRPYLFFLSGVTGLLGLALPSQIDMGTLIPCFLAFFFSYGLGQALTDVFQTDTDSISSPYRPLVRGLITKGQVTSVSLLGLCLCAVVFFAVNPWTLVFATLGIIGLATYTPFKRRWWAGPAWNSAVVALLPVIGSLCGGDDPKTVFGDPRLLYVMVSAFFSYAIFVLLGYHKDISADRETGYNTIPVRIGWRPSVFISLLYWVAGTAASLLLIVTTKVFDNLQAVPYWVAAGLWIAGTVVFFMAHLIMLRTREESQAYHSISFVVRGYVLLHLGEAVALLPHLWGFALVFYGLFEIVLAIRPEKSQI